MLMTFFFRGYAAINNILVVFGRVDLKRCYIMGRQENFAFISLQVGSLFFYVFPPIWWIFYLLFSVDWYNSIFYLTENTKKDGKFYLLEISPKKILRNFPNQTISNVAASILGLASSGRHG